MLCKEWMTDLRKFQAYKSIILYNCKNVLLYAYISV